MEKNTFLRSKVLAFLCVSFVFLNIQSQSINLLPAISEPSTNPFAATTFDGVKVGDTKLYGFQKDPGETMTAAFAYFHPSSPYKGQSAILDRMVLLLDSIFTRWSVGKTADLGDFPGAVEATYSYLTLKTYAPDKIPADRKAKWEAGIKNKNNYMIANFPGIFVSNSVGALVMNMEIKRIFAVFLGGLCLNDTAVANKGKRAMENCLFKNILPDGGTHYVSYSNETMGYHSITVEMTAWYYLFTGSQVARNFLFALKNYSPMSQMPNGYDEYSTAPPWKSQYVTKFLSNSALMEGFLTGCGYNYTMGQGQKGLLYAFIYRSGITALPLPDNFTLYDRNTLGPRSHYGLWTTVGTTRDPSTPLPEITETPNVQMCGISTFAGAAITKSDGTINAAFHGAAPMVKYATGDEDDWNRGNKWGFMTGPAMKTSLSKGREVYGLASAYNIYKRDFTNSTGWKSCQQWVYTPGRVIGMTEITNSASSTVYGLAQRIALVSYRGTAKPGDGKAAKLVFVDNNTFEYNNLRVKVQSKDFTGKIDTTYYGIYSTTVPTSTDFGSVMIALNDAQSGNDVAVTYPAGTKRYALFEVTYNTKSYSSNAARLTLATGLEGFEFQETGRKVRMIHNTTASAISYSGTMTCPFGSARILQSWNDALNPLTVAAASTTIPPISIPAYGNIVIVNSDIANDQTAGYLKYDDVFTGALLIPVDVKADSVRDTKSFLSWKAVPGATGYKVKRATVAGGPYTTIATTFSPSYTDTGLTENTTYYYVVTATNSTLESAASDPLMARTALSTALNPNFERQIQLFPNPAKHHIKITHAENSKISVTDCLGKQVWSQQSQQVDSQIDVSQWTPGIYNVEISKGKCQVNRKLIVTR
ncbi:MAG: T9SS type A sorting domain-containing protein [Bacteroidales bacterium]